MANAGAAPGVGYEILGAVKIKDGVFIGDELAAQDLEFVVANKVTHVINCCGRSVPNHWESIGVVYLTYYWVDNENQIILDNKDVVANECFHFLEEALSNAESILIHSVRGQSRSCVVLAAYMMRKYSWGLRKTMEFLSSRRPDINLKPAFVQQLSCYERRLIANSKNRSFTTDWADIPSMSVLDGDELLLRNTFMNSQTENLTQASVRNEKPKNRSRAPLVWADSGLDDKSKLEKGGDKPHCKTGPNGEIVLQSIIKIPRENRAQQQGQMKHTSLASRPTTASSSEETVQPDSSSEGRHKPGPNERPSYMARNNDETKTNTAMDFRQSGVIANSAGASQPMNVFSNGPTAFDNPIEPAENTSHTVPVNPTNNGFNSSANNAFNNTGNPHSNNSMNNNTNTNVHASPRSSKYFNNNSMMGNAMMASNNGTSAFVGNSTISVSSNTNANMANNNVGLSSASNNTTSAGHNNMVGNNNVGHLNLGVNHNNYSHAVGHGGPGNTTTHNPHNMSLPPSMLANNSSSARSRRPSDSRDSDDQANFPEQRRHSIGGAKRDESPMLLPFHTSGTRNRSMDKEPPNNMRRREASPKLDRQLRGDSPMRVPTHGRPDLRSVSNQGSRASSHDGRLNGSPHRHPSGLSSYDKSYEKVQHNNGTNFGGLLGSLRPGGSAPKGRMSGMNAFRNSGPVKAHRSAAPEVFGTADSGLRKSSTRPATAPSTRVLTSSGAQQYGSRPNSPLLQRGSRPGSPVCGRPPSPSRGANQALQSSVNQALGLNFRTKSLSSHMRRAPSPTPAFNRAPSPSRPRWRM